jgi:hypothetical protein
MMELAQLAMESAGLSTGTAMSASSGFNAPIVTDMAMYGGIADTRGEWILLSQLDLKLTEK